MVIGQIFGHQGQIFGHVGYMFGHPGQKSKLIILN